MVSEIIKHSSDFFLHRPRLDRFLMYGSLIISSYVIMTFYFTFSICFITNSTFSRSFEIFMINFIENKRLITFCFSYFTTIFTFFIISLKIYRKHLRQTRFCIVCYIVYKCIIINLYKIDIIRFRYYKNSKSPYIVNGAFVHLLKL